MNPERCRSRRLSSLRASLAAAAGLAVFACSAPPEREHAAARSSATEAPANNVLVIVLDDVGVDKVGVYGEHPSPPPTPNLDALARGGVLFRRAYAQPWCSPSRACLLTGRYGFRTGVGNPISQQQADGSLPDAEITLPEAFELAAPGRIDTSAIGKWHLTSRAANDWEHPNRQGFRWFEGTIGNLGSDRFDDYAKLTNGVLTRSTRYATSEQVDDALARMAAMTQPWFLYLSFNAIHEPFHAPPRELHDRELAGEPWATAVEHSAAAMQALDAEIGRLLASMPPKLRASTTVVVVGDNGTADMALAPPWKGPAKGQVSEAGTRVPMIVAGAAVKAPGRECRALVQVVDLFATVGELLDLDLRAALPPELELDSLSFAAQLRDPAAPPLRDHVYTETFAPNGRGPYTTRRRAIRDERWKLVEGWRGADRLFDLSADPFGEVDLLARGALDDEQRTAYARLLAKLRAMAGD